MKTYKYDKPEKKIQIKSQDLSRFDTFDAFWSAKLPGATANFCEENFIRVENDFVSFRVERGKEGEKVSRNHAGKRYFSVLKIMIC